MPLAAQNVNGFFQYLPGFFSFFPFRGRSDRSKKYDATRPALTWWAEKRCRLCIQPRANTYSARIDFGRQNLTSVDVRFWVKSRSQYCKKYNIYVTTQHQYEKKTPTYQYEMGKNNPTTNTKRTTTIVSTQTLIRNGQKQPNTNTKWAKTTQRPIRCSSSGRSRPLILP